ncbi:UPF0235 domain-containing protein [Candidatus Protochlamydia naegleriophila]|uniref:UPF0235 protein PNK_1845 n=1 Tax=Candidatus Protochlamydia naegleriophila TaxID=389348 RepID=A0A0U5K5P6_9BACT|nr:DUF167 domain-containing protein [Candidatus Protochlamydia naegleriophila]CUI17451.1 UPF0235 domain-containing protein [Candidatus Protochlamydia naegleriophila]
MFQQTNQGIVLKVKVIPKASRSQIAGWEGEELKVRLAAVPDKGQANAELVRFLADLLDIGKSHIQLIQGETSRHKRLCLTNISLDQLQKKLPLKLE